MPKKLIKIKNTKKRGLPTFNKKYMRFCILLSFLSFWI
jgi:hypothetical protein